MITLKILTTNLQFICWLGGGGGWQELCPDVCVCPKVKDMGPFPVFGFLFIINTEPELIQVAMTVYYTHMECNLITKPFIIISKYCIDLQYIYILTH